MNQVDENYNLDDPSSSSHTNQSESPEENISADYEPTQQQIDARYAARLEQELIQADVSYLSSNYVNTFNFI